MARCILCGGTSHVIEEYSIEDYEKGYTLHYGEVPKGLFHEKSSMCRCESCGLVFAAPLKPGSNEYYEWVTKHGDYYAVDRWEWHVISDYLKKNESNNMKLLEVGCGSGYFLDFLRKHNPNVETIGVDMTMSSVEECRKKGLNAYCGTLEDYLKEFPDKKYDYVMSFHCLEHVFNPKEYVLEMLKVCKKDGLCVNAIPYTDTSAQPWWDVLNSPPHHMTRWNNDAIEELGKQVQCDIEILAKRGFNVWEESIGMLKRRYYSHYNFPTDKWCWIKLLLLHPRAFFKELYRNMNRDRIVFYETIGGVADKHRAPYHITMIFKPK